MIPAHLQTQSIPFPSQQQIIEAVLRDPGISQEQKYELRQKLQDPTFMQRLLVGVGGATIGSLIAKFMSMGRTAQILLGLAGFGIGNLLLSQDRSPSKLVTYNDRYKNYEIRTEKL
jgi:hypothetical protein